MLKWWESEDGKSEMGKVLPLWKVEEDKSVDFNSSWVKSNMIDCNKRMDGWIVPCRGRGWKLLSLGLTLTIESLERVVDNSMTFFCVHKYEHNTRQTSFLFRRILLYNVKLLCMINVIDIFEKNSNYFTLR